MTDKHDMSAIFDSNGYAIFLPAISSFYTKKLSQIKQKPDHNRVPNGLEYGLEGMDYLKKENSYFFYKYSLYSAGHVQLDLERAEDEECMIHKRDKNSTVIVGDSGGYQIGTGILKMDWSNAKDPNDPERTSVCKTILEWLEHTTDWAMTLDVPGWIPYSPRYREKTGLTEFEDTLYLTKLNLDYFIANRTPEKTKFLNVMSGSTDHDSKIWYEGVKKYSDPDKVEKMGYSRDRALEGYSFAGVYKKSLRVTLERFLDLIDDGIIEDKDWMHFLGLGRLDWACYLTALQRVLRKYHNPNLRISFDAASPFVTTIYGRGYTYNSFHNKRFIYGTGQIVDSKEVEGDDAPLPFDSPILNRLTVGDMCPLSRAHAVVEGQHRFDISKADCNKLIEEGIDAYWKPEVLNRNGKTTKTSWDTLSYFLLMGHNVYKHVDAVQEANKLVDMEYRRLRPDWRDWVRDKRNSQANELSPYVPHAVLYFISFVEDLFNPDTKNPRELLEQNRAFLDSIDSDTSKKTAFNSLFSEVIDTEDVDKFADMNDEKLIEFENQEDEVIQDDLQSNNTT